MTYTIRDNNGNVVFSIENVNPEVSFESINAEFKDINEYSNKLNKSIEAFNLISNTKAMEALGYVKGAGFKENVKAVSHEIWEKIKKFCENLVDVIKKAFKNIKEKMMKMKNSVLKQYAKIGAKVLASSINNDQSLSTVSKTNAKTSIISLIESDRMATLVIAYKNFDKLKKASDKISTSINKLLKNKYNNNSLDLLNDKGNDVYNSEKDIVDKIDIDRLEEKVSYNEKVSVALKFFKDIETGRYDTVLLPYASTSLDSILSMEKALTDIINSPSAESTYGKNVMILISKELQFYPKIIQIFLKFIAVSSEMYNMAINAGKTKD